MQTENIFKFLREKWTLQLHREYDDICYQYGIRLKKPLLVVQNHENSWGFWDKSKKILLISEELIKKYSWEIVIHVLKHEMAHQIVSDIFNVDEAHGPYFKRACKMLGLDDEYCRATLSMNEQFIHWKSQKVESEEESLLKKIQKLLNLAQSSNEHEAALAMEKVQELYEKYNIQKIKLGQTQNYFNLIINFKKKRIPITHSIAACILQEHFFVKIILSSLYDCMADTSHKTIELMGSRQNVLMAEFVFYFLVERIDLLWVNYSRQKNLGVKYKLSYQQGILNGFSKKLDTSKDSRTQENLKQEPQLHALIRLNDVELKNFVQFKHPKLTTKSGSSSGVYSEHFQEGQAEGKKLNLNKPIQHNNSSEKRFLN
ncbi:MAG: DUF2786 domain-containing protein [Bdellovibrionota bacterium]